MLNIKQRFMSVPQVICLELSYRGYDPSDPVKSSPP